MPALRASLAAALAALLLLSACATIPVTTDYDETAEFLFYRTFAVMPAPRAADRDPVESLTATRVRQALTEGLLAKGMAAVPRAEADLWARWRMRFRDRMVLVDRYPGPFRHRDRRLEVIHFREGVFTIELVDRAQGRVVWEGAATGVVDDRGGSRDTIRRAVAAILEKYPPMH